MSADLIDSLNIIESYSHRYGWSDWVESYKDNVDSEIDDKVDFDTILKYICESLQVPFDYVSQEFKGKTSSKKKQLSTYVEHYFKDLRAQKVDEPIIIRFDTKSGYLDDKSNLFFEEDCSIGDMFETAKAVWTWRDTTATFSPSDRQIGNFLTIDMDYNEDDEDDAADEEDDAVDEEDAAANGEHDE